MKTKQYTIVVLDYACVAVRFWYLRKEPKDVEDWLEKHDEDWKASQCYWMCAPGVITPDLYVLKHD